MSEVIMSQGYLFPFLCTFISNKIKRVVIETTGVCDVTMISRRYVFCDTH